MDIYKQRSRWKVLLGIVALIILVITTLYSNYLANRLKENEEKNIYIYTEALKDLLNPTVVSGEYNDLNRNVPLQDSIVRAFPLPVIFEDETGNLEGFNWSDDVMNDAAFLRQKKAEFLEEGIRQPIEGTGYISKIYCFNSPLLRYIKYYPLVQFVMVGLFIFLGYFTFSSSRKAEQNRVWAGMAKETAHQLGTPISAILAWIEHLKASDMDEYQLDVVDELKKDVDRLELVADRFSKIGSAPSLERINLYDELQEVKRYMERRAPKKVTFDFPKPQEEYYVNINQHLFDWVIENLIRNSLDAMTAVGQIKAEIYKDGDNVSIDLTDSGKGIPSSKFKTVFQPGFSTKKRGWGLGLSLAKRIIENYHQGKIYVKASKMGEGTTFTIKLPLLVS